MNTSNRKVSKRLFNLIIINHPFIPPFQINIMLPEM